MRVNRKLVDLEIQVRDEHDFPERTLFHWAREYSTSLGEGGKYSELPQVIIISIMAFRQFECKEYHSEFRPLEVTRHTQLCDKMVMHCFELPKLPSDMPQGISYGIPQGISAGNGLVLGLNLFIFFMYIRLMSSYEARLENQALQSQLAAQTRQNRLIEGAQKQAGEIRHEMKNLLFGLQIELEHENYAGAKTRIAALLGEMKQYELKPYTMIPVIDAMISYKGEKLREAGAAFSASAEPLNVSDELAYDLASLLAIALDNAIDAVGFTGISHAGFAVRLDISRKKNLLFIQLSNPLVKPLKYRDGELQTTKEEPGHGLGLPALRRIVERYSGELRINGQDGTFLLKVMLMN